MTHYKDKKEKAYFSRHAYLETDIDTALLDLKLHRQPCNFHTEDTIRLTHRQKHVIASMLYYAYRYAFPDVKFRKYTMYLAIFPCSLVSGWCTMIPERKGHCPADGADLSRISAVFTTDPEWYLVFRTDPFNLRHALWKIHGILPLLPMRVSLNCMINPKSCTCPGSIRCMLHFMQVLIQQGRTLLYRIFCRNMEIFRFTAGWVLRSQVNRLGNVCSIFQSKRWLFVFGIQIPRTNKNTAQICAVFFISVFCFCILLLITDQQAVCKVSIPVFIYHFHQRSHGSVLQWSSSVSCAPQGLPMQYEGWWSDGRCPWCVSMDFLHSSVLRSAHQVRLLRSFYFPKHLQDLSRQRSVLCQGLKDSRRFHFWKRLCIQQPFCLLCQRCMYGHDIWFCKQLVKLHTLITRLVIFPVVE